MKTCTVQPPFPSAPSLRRSLGKPIAAVVGVACAALAGCATPTGPAYTPPPAYYAPPPPPPPVDPFAWSHAPGAGMIEGRVFGPGGVRGWTCEGQSVALIPEAPSSRRRMVALYGSDRRAQASIAEVRARAPALTDPSFAQHVRTTKCDRRSAFSFGEVPDGAWFVVARARPLRASAAADAGLVYMQRVVSRGGEPLVLALPEPPRTAPATGQRRRTG